MPCSTHSLCTEVERAVKFLTTPITNNYNMAEMNWLVETADLLAAIEHGKTPLHVAAQTDDDDHAQRLINRGCNVDATTDDGITPLSHAVRRKSTSVIKVLLAANADIFHKGPHQRCAPAQMVLASDSYHEASTILAFLERIRKDASGDSAATAKLLLRADCSFPRAVLLKDAEITRCMLELGSRVNDVDRVGNTALHYAVEAMDWEQVDLLIERRADVKAMNKLNRTPLHLYGYGDDQGLKILRALLNKNAPLYDRDFAGRLPLAEILRRQDSETVRLVLEHGVDLDATNDDGTSLLHHVVSNDKPGVIQQLRGRKFNVNAVDVNGETPFWSTFGGDRSESLKFLLENGGADLNILNRDGYTAFFHAFCWFVVWKMNGEHCLKIIELFLQYGAAVDCVNKDGETIFDYALLRDNFVLTRPILEYVAMWELIGKPVAKNEIFLSKIDAHEKFRSHFEFCKRTIEKMKRVVIFGKVTLFNFLKDDNEKLEKYARNAELVEKLKRVMYSLRHSKLYFVKCLRRRVEKAINVAELRGKATDVLLKIEGLGNNDYVAEKILTYIDGEDLRNLCMI